VARGVDVLLGAAYLLQLLRDLADLPDARVGVLLADGESRVRLFAAFAVAEIV
jgi:hypothetical protein